MNTQLDATQFNFYKWLPPLDVEQVKGLIREDLTKALKPLTDRGELVSKVEVQTATNISGWVMHGWEERLDALVDMSVTTEELVTVIEFGSVGLEFYFEFPAA